MSKNLIRFIGLVLCIQMVILNGISVGSYADDEVKILINNQNLVADVPAQIIDGRTLVPLRAIFEALGIEVSWNGENQMITGTKGDTVIKLQVGNQKATVNGAEMEISVPPKIINGRSMVPVRFISESVGAKVDWDGETRSVYVTYEANASKVNSLYVDDGIAYAAKVEGRNFLVYENKTWQKKFLKGVNMGAAKPGTFPGELAITKEEYLRWFQYISDMNAEVIRVYTTLKPDFYDALSQFNKTSKKPLYLMQGVWINEGTISKLMDAYGDNEKIKNDFIKDTTDLVDIFHGNATLPFQYGFANGEYKSDVSEYVIGWILGIEWDPHFVEGTNNNNPSKTSYSGNYLYTEGASPFEAFLCEVGDKILEYEATKYQMQRPLSFTNWLTTDPLKHPNEPSEYEDKVEVNTEHIKPQNLFKTGLFASYHVYPYYPEFINYQKEYVAFKDENGRINTYKAYLRDLFKAHTVPVLVAEFGVPASRGKTHDNVHTGFNQGNHDETKQGEIIKSMVQDIYDEGYCGSLIFAWQDEWFKRTWNTMDLDLPDTRPFWSNPQTNEQEFGLLAFDPGKERSICYVDGDTSEWNGDKPIYTASGANLFAKSDEKYIYLMVETEDFDFNKDTLYIPVDSLSEQGNASDKGRNISFQRPADFLIQINGEKNSKILVDANYDSNYYVYAEKLGMIDLNTAYRNKGAGIFNPIYLTLNRAMYLPEDKTTVPFSKYETGALVHGNGNPGHSNFNSLADFNYREGKIEIRIPWQLLNIMDPSTKAIMGDLYANKGIKAESVEGIYFGAGIVKAGEGADSEIGMGYFTWEPWHLPTFHERLKPSYYIMQKVFEEIK